MFCSVLFCFCQTRAVSGIKGLFHRNPKQASLDSHAAAQHTRKHLFGAHLLRRTASAPTKGQPKIKKGFPEIATETKDYSSEGASDERESEGKASAAVSHQPTTSLHHNGASLARHQDKGPLDHPDTNGGFHPEEGKGKSSLFTQCRPMSEPLKRVNRLHFHEPLDAKPGVFARVAVNSSGKVGMSSNCITCVMGSESPECEQRSLVKERQGCKSKRPHGQGQERHNQTTKQVPSESVAKPHLFTAHADLKECLPLPKPHVEAQFQYSPQALQPFSFPRNKVRQTLGTQHIQPQSEPSRRIIQSCSVPRRRSRNTVTPSPSLTADCRTQLKWQQGTHHNYGTVCSPNINVLLLSDSSSCDSLSSLSSMGSPPTLPPCSVLDNRKRAVGTLQREMNALFAQKMEELRLRSPMFFAGKISVRQS